MDAQNILSGFSPKSAVPSIRIGKQSFFLKLPLKPSPSPYHSVQFQKRGCCEAFCPITYRVCSEKRIRCNAEQARVVTAVEEHIRAQVRRKKLAVFVSGGGSNFRSIHEASLRGSVHGDVVVLVTNKKGMLFFIPYQLVAPLLCLLLSYYN